MIKKKKVKWGDFVFDPSTQEAGHPWFIEEPCLNKSKLKINKKRKKKNLNGGVVYFGLWLQRFYSQVSWPSELFLGLWYKAVPQVKGTTRQEVTTSTSQKFHPRLASRPVTGIWGHDPDPDHMSQLPHLVPSYFKWQLYSKFTGDQPSRPTAKPRG